MFRSENYIIRHKLNLAVKYLGVNILIIKKIKLYYKIIVCKVKNLNKLLIRPNYDGPYSG